MAFLNAVLVLSLIAALAGSAQTVAAASVQQLRTFGGGAGGPGGPGGPGGAQVNVTLAIPYSNSSNYRTGYELVNFSQGHTANFTINNDTFTVTTHFISPTGCEIDVNGKVYSIAVNQTLQLSGFPASNYSVLLTKVSYPPILHTVTLIFYTVVPPKTTTVTTATTSASTTVPTTTAPSTNVKATPLLPVAASVGIAVVVAIAVGGIYVTSREKDNKAPKKESQEQEQAPEQEIEEI